MNRNPVESNWKRLTDVARERWGKLAGDDPSGPTPGFHIFTELIKWIAIPILLFASMFSYCALQYEAWLTGAVILSAIIFIGRAVRSRQYFWSVGLVGIIVAFSPLFLATKIFLEMGLLCIATLAAVATGFRTQPLPVV